jgi:hypothetical protein
LSHTFRAGNLPPEIQEVFSWLETALNAAQPEFTYQVRNVAPTKTWAGLSTYADGVNWNPGYGEGLYVRDKNNAAWVPAGGRTYSKYFLLMGA